MILGSILAGSVVWRVLLLVIAAGCGGEYVRLKKRGFWATFGGVFAIVFCTGIMWGFPRELALVFVATVWANDVFAYLTGVALGRHKMAPHISPQKSWEGFVGGLVGAMAVATALGQWLAQPVTDSWLVWAGFGLMVALGAVGGDLVESAVKRRAGVKDSGRVFPGHGGFLDRFDALLGAAPIAYVFMKIFFR